MTRAQRLLLIAGTVVMLFALVNVWNIYLNWYWVKYVKGDVFSDLFPIQRDVLRDDLHIWGPLLLSLALFYLAARRKGVVATMAGVQRFVLKVGIQRLLLIAGAVAMLVLALQNLWNIHLDGIGLKYVLRPDDAQSLLYALSVWVPLALSSLLFYKSAGKGAK